MSGHVEGDHGPAPAPTAPVLGAGLPSPISQEPHAQNIPSMDQMVLDIISKATAQAPHPTFTTPLMPSNQFNQAQYPAAPLPPNYWNPPRISAHPIPQTMAPPQLPPSSASQQPASSLDPSNGLPQDILHILQSDFTSNPIDAQAQKDQEISRVAAELRVKARLSRYRRVRDQLSDSEDEECERGEGSETSGEDSEGGSEENTEDHQNNNPEIKAPQGDAEADLIDGSGDEEEEREEKNETLAKIRGEIEQIIGAPPAASPAGLSEGLDDKTGLRSDEENKPARADEPPHDLQTEICRVAGTQEHPQTTSPGEAKGAAAAETIEHHELSITDNLLAQVKAQIDQLHKSAQTPSMSTPQQPPETCPNGDPLPGPQAAIPTSLSTTTTVGDKIIQPGSSSIVGPKVTQPRKKRAPKKRAAEPADSGEESEDGGQESNGPTTVNELKEPPPEITEVPFTRVPEEAMNSINPFGSIASLIGNVLVIQGTAGLGYDRVLDEGTLVCQKDGLVIGKIFETFGSVTNPHYSIRLPKHIVACKNGNDTEGPDLSPGLVLYYLPTHSNFAFTAELRSQPKGTDASNLYDEEPPADEIEFSDDEAEVAYRQACKLARKTARDLNGNSHQQNQPKQQHRNPVQVSENGRRITSDHLNYGTDDGNSQSGNGTVESDYSLLQRPKESATSIDPLTSFKTTNRQSSAQRSRGNKRGTGGRDRNRKRPPQSHALASKPGTGAPTGSPLPTGNQRPHSQPDRTTQSGFMNSPPPTTNPNHPQAQTGNPGSMLGAPGPMNMGFAGMHTSSAYMPAMWTTPAQNQMMVPMMNQHYPQAAIPSYNPRLPAAQLPDPASNPMFQFGFPNFNNTHQFAAPSQQQQQLAGHSLPANPSFQFHQHPQVLNPHIHDQQPRQAHTQPQNNQSAFHPSALSETTNLGHFNPWFWRPS